MQVLGYALCLSCMQSFKFVYFGFTETLKIQTHTKRPTLSATETDIVRDPHRDITVSK